MSESYTTGGDSLVRATTNVRLGQTFNVLEEHILHWIDLEIRPYAFYPYPVLLLYWANASHEPYSDYLSRNRWITYSKRIALLTQRVRFSMQPYLLTPGISYCFILQRSGGFPPTEPAWQYDANDATYPRGHRIYSNDGGATWTHHFNDDHIFVEFGEPPAPPPPPEPPIHNWAILTIGQILTATGYILIPVTNVPCHLYMYWTTHEPDKHDRTIIQRGLAVPAATQYCFVDWHQNEQAEPGDTLVHTFTKEPWPVCETRWFIFRAKIDNEWAPSISPIFKKHRTAPPPPEWALIFTEHWTS